MIRFTAGIIMATLAMAPALAKDTAPQTWKAGHSLDPLTGISRCIVSALDYAGKTRFSRTGYLYPVIEKNGTHGLLVGISSGGRYRLPTGTILWRVDDRPYRELKAEDNPTLETAAPETATSDAATRAMTSTVELTNRLVRAATATSTLASGETAISMLQELREGRGLLYRAQTVSADYGLPDQNLYRVGQFSKEGLKPVPVDASLESALAECDIH